jgi:hypothetical protein
MHHHCYNSHSEKWLSLLSIQKPYKAFSHVTASVCHSSTGAPCVLPPYRHITLQMVFLLMEYIWVIYVSFGKHQVRNAIVRCHRQFPLSTRVSSTYVFYVPHQISSLQSDLPSYVQPTNFFVISQIRQSHYAFHELCPVASSDSELTSETMNRITYFGWAPWTGDRPIAMPLPTEDSTTEQKEGMHPRFERDSNPQSQCSGGQRPYVLLDRAVTGFG